MGLMNGALQVGRSALLSYQSALHVIGNNVSNAGSASYTRQTPVLTPYQGTALPEGFLSGGGVALTMLQRNIDESLEGRLRVAMGDHQEAHIRQQTVSRIESVLNELSDTALSSLLQEFFNSFQTLQNAPTDVAVRGMALQAGDAVVREIGRQRQDVLMLRDELNGQVASMTTHANKLANDIAELNKRITAAEGSAQGGANALRDQRDELLRELSTIIQIQVREQPGGSINVYVGNELLISGGMNRGLTWTLETVGNEPRAVVRFADSQRVLVPRGGKIAGLISARDEHVMAHVEALNNLAQVLIGEVNKVHAVGQGLTGFTQLTGAFHVEDPDRALDRAGLALTPQNGSFVLYVTNTQTSPPSRTATTIAVDLDGVGNDETLSTLAAKINAVTGVTAEVTTDYRLKLAADPDHEITFGEDSSNVLAALGLNVFFVGSSAEDLAVNPDLVNNVDLLAASTQHAPGDGSNAGALAALSTTALQSLGGQSVMDYYHTLATNIAVKGAAAVAELEASNAIVLSLSAQRESISGVNLDEEVIALMKMERAFGAAARFTTVVDRLMDEVLALVR